MKILYAIQGTGNGHICRARDIVPALQKNHDVDILISGSQADVPLPFPVKYTFKGLGFIFGKDGGIDLLETYRKNNLKTLFREINELPVTDYDLVINDFEPVSAWACIQKNKECIALSHQAAVLNKHVPQPKKTDFVGKAILKKYAPTSAQYGFHFRSYDNHIYTPVIRAEVRQEELFNDGHYTVYLPAYDDKRILKVLREIKHTRWEVFSKHNKKAIQEKNISIQPVSNRAFIKSMASSAGILCGAGFETPAEALFMQKKLMVIPMKGQFEQQCNAAVLKKMGVPVLKNLKLKRVKSIRSWIDEGGTVIVDYPDNTQDIIDHILMKHTTDPTSLPVTVQPGNRSYSAKQFRSLVLKTIAPHL